MIAEDRAHRAPTLASAVKQDEAIRLWVRDLADASAATGSVAETVRRLLEHGDYWERVQRGRLQTLKRAMARLMQPFFRPQVRYNRMVAEHLGRIEVALDEVRREVEALRDAIEAKDSP